MIIKEQILFDMNFNIAYKVQLTFSRDIIDLVIHCLYIEILMKSDIFGREKGRVIFSEIKIPSLFNRASLAIAPKMEATQMEIFNFLWLTWDH